MAAFLGADHMHACGFMAVFVFGLILGNRNVFGFTMEEDETRRPDEFDMTTALIARMFIFLLLGSQLDFSLMNRHLAGGVIVVTVFMLVARPVTVFIWALPDRRASWKLNELLFMCSTRETGVIPAALARLTPADYDRECQLVREELQKADKPYLQEFLEARQAYERILLDPPRSGAAAALDIVGNIRPGRVVYVSCHPGSLARDAARLVEGFGYRLLAAGVMDMFPHTAHVESIALFEAP
jgi:hypothetical protein